ncbi:hypothetical protein LguiA_025738 [Lonicera macranthoides]
MARQLHGLRIETIKPASLTPSHLKRFNLSPTDQVTPRIYMPIVFYYPNHVPTSLKDIADKSNQLKSSLSEILTHYYPFAGRLNCGAYVDCNDDGVEFQEANIKCGLSEILEKPQNEAVDLVFPSGLAWGKMEKCSKSVGHSAYKFRMWRNVNCEWPRPKKRKVTRRFMFPNSKLALLKAMADERLSNTTRVEVLTALLYKCAVATTTTNSGSLSQVFWSRPKNASTVA